MSDVPTLKEELDRKSLNALAMLQSDKENFRISEEVYEYAKKILWECFAGIVDQEFMNLMEQMDAEPYLKKNQILYKHCKEDSFFLLEFDLPEGRAKIVKDGQTIKILEYDNQKILKDHLTKIITKIVSKGYLKHVKQNS